MSPAFETFIAPAQARAGAIRTVSGLVLILGLYAALNGLAVIALAALAGPGAAELAIAKAAVGSTPGSALTALSTFVPLAAAVVIVTAVLHRRGPGTLMGRGWMAETLRGALALAVLLAAAGLATAGRLPPPEPNLPLAIWLTVLPLALSLVAVQTLSEELLFRGYLMQQVAARTGSARAALWLSAALFAAAHAAPGTFGGAWPLPVAAAFIFGLIAGDLTIRHGNIGAAWGLHFVNNCAALLLVATEGPLTGLALTRSALTLEDLATRPGLLLIQLAPLLIAWAVLRRATPG